MFEDIKARNMGAPRMFVPTSIIEPTLLNSKRIKIRVTEGSVRHGGLFAANYILYKISTEPLGWTIFRKDMDFYQLRKILLKQHPYMIIPPLPVKKKKEADKSIRRRETYFTRFLQALSHALTPARVLGLNIRTLDGSRG